MSDALDLRPLRDLEVKWRKGCRGVEAEIRSGLRSYHDEGPRYGIAAVESCADDLAAVIRVIEQQKEEEMQTNQDVTRVAPLTAGVVGQDLPRSDNEVSATLIAQNALQAIASQSMFAASDPHLSAATYRRTLGEVCSLALRALDESAPPRLHVIGTPAKSEPPAVLGGSQEAGKKL